MGNGRILRGQGEIPNRNRNRNDNVNRYLGRFMTIGLCMEYLVLII